MAQYLFNPPAVQSLPIRGQDERFPINRLFFVGRNYHAHAVEMGRPVDKSVERAFYFTKSRDTLVDSGATVAYPPETQNYHFEMEMVIAIGKPGFRVAEDKAHELIYGYATGLDMTRRDLQGEAKKMGRPWEMGKAFDNSAPCTALKPVSMVGHPAKGAIWLKVNGEVKQKGDLAEMIWNVPETIAYLSNLITLRPGDVFMSGTPAGVGPVKAGDKLEGHVEGVGDLTVSYAK